MDGARPATDLPDREADSPLRVRLRARRSALRRAGSREGPESLGRANRIHADEPLVRLLRPPSLRPRRRAAASLFNRNEVPASGWRTHGVAGRGTLRTARELRAHAGAPRSSRHPQYLPLGRRSSAPEPGPLIDPPNSLT